MRRSRLRDNGGVKRDEDEDESGDIEIVTVGGSSSSEPASNVTESSLDDEKNLIDNPIRIWSYVYDNDPEKRRSSSNSSTGSKAQVVKQ